ncbi:MAG: glycerol-3-phosphate 1-O-acyltransferase PlsY [Candidatus Binatia bacterium]
MLLSAYLLGSIPTGFLLGVFSGVDIRRTGSKNIGATNVARVVGWKIGLITLIADAGKGFIPVVLSLQLDFSLHVSALTGLLAFLGHLYPVFLKFRGGKGVATALGVFVGFAFWGYSPGPILSLLAIFLVVVYLNRHVSLASVVSAGAAPLALWYFSYPISLVGLGLAIGLLIIARHRDNIRRLLAGEEPRFSFHRKTSQVS